MFLFKANTAAFAGGLIYFLTYFPCFFLSGNTRYASMTQVQKILASLLSNVAMAFGVKTIAEYEGTGKCVIIKIYNAFDWSTISKRIFFLRLQYKYDKIQSLHNFCTYINLHFPIS